MQALGIGAMLAGADLFAAYVLQDAGQNSILFVCLVGITASAGTQLFRFPMLPDTISRDTARTGLRRAGAFTGVWTAGEKGGMAAGPALYALVLAAAGFVETESGAIIDQPAAAVTGVLVGLAVVPAGPWSAPSLPYARRLSVEVAPFDLTVPGVRSMSMDLHKYAD